jgi:DnaJ-class molecular chaperone
MHLLLSKHLATYSPEDCATCNGSGRLGVRNATAGAHIPVRSSVFDDEKTDRFIALYASLDSLPECVVCRGRGSVLVLQPSRKCLHCAGDGRGLQPRCMRCEGTGWMFAWKER